MMENALNWATSNGPPNWVFVVALLTSPMYWSKYVKKAAKDFYNNRFNGGEE